jgi:DNA repair protein RecN (Recombination protein N)
MLSASRKVATKALDQAMEQELSPLKMDRAVFKTDISKTEAGSQGWDLVQFLVSTNPGTPAGPLAKIASGGELSRFLLALKVCLRTSEDTRTVIFDEIDRGVGGATADAVGRRLSALAENAQVLVVTHSPQVAAFASRHFKVHKTQSDHETLSQVEDLDPASRIGEIARMISGDTITSEARAAAEALIMMKD